MNRYSVGYDERTARFFEERTADTHAQFLLEYLVPGADKWVLAQLKSSFLTWGEMPEAFAAEAWGEIVARKT